MVANSNCRVSILDYYVIDSTAIKEEVYFFNTIIIPVANIIVIIFIITIDIIGYWIIFVVHTIIVNRASTHSSHYIIKGIVVEVVVKEYLNY